MVVEMNLTAAQMFVRMWPSRYSFAGGGFAILSKRMLSLLIQFMCL